MDVNERTHTSAIAVIVIAASAMVEEEKKIQKAKKKGYMGQTMAP